MCQCFENAGSCGSLHGEYLRECTRQHNSNFYTENFLEELEEFFTNQMKWNEFTT